MLINYSGTDQSIDVFIESMTSPGQGLTGLVYNTTGLECYYRVDGAGTVTQLNLANQTATGAHTDGGFAELDASHMPGMYRLDISDAMSQMNSFVTVYLSGASGMYPARVRLEPRVLSITDSQQIRYRLGLDGTQATPSWSTGAELVDVDGLTFQQAVRCGMAGLGGKVSGVGTTQEVYLGADGSSTRLTVTLDANNNRTAVTYGTA